MRNYIIIHHFSDEEQDQRFKEEIKNEFPEHKFDIYQETAYFTFPAREQPEVEDKINTLLSTFGIGSEDFVALYYTRPEAPDEINRVMMLGHDEFIDTHMEKIPTEKHHEMLGNLLEFDFLKERNKS